MCQTVWVQTVPKTNQQPALVVRKVAKIRNQYNQVPHLPRITHGKELSKHFIFNMEKQICFLKTGVAHNRPINISIESNGNKFKLL